MPAKRTRKGTITQATRKRSGAKGGKLKRGSFPVVDKRSALAAVRLRGHAKSKKAVLDKVSRSKAGKDPAVKAAVKKARAKDKKR